MESERQTRRDRIDPRLKSAGWKVVDFKGGLPIAGLSGHAIAEYPTENGPADYAFVVDGQLLGIVEAKKVTLGPQNVLTQAERYSKGAADGPINFRGYRVPFLYSTNGEIVWFHDVRHKLNRSRPIARFHQPAALAEMLARQRFEGLADLLHREVVLASKSAQELRFHQVDEGQHGVRRIGKLE